MKSRQVGRVKEVFVVSCLIQTLVPRVHNHKQLTTAADHGQRKNGRATRKRYC